MNGEIEEHPEFGRKYLSKIVTSSKLKAVYVEGKYLVESGISSNAKYKLYRRKFGNTRLLIRPFSGRAEKFGSDPASSGT